MGKLRSTKVIATIGPACDSPAAIGELIDAGMDVARLNFSHGTHESHAEVAARVRTAAEERGANVAIMVDTRGPEIRTGDLAVPTVTLGVGAHFTLFFDGRVGDENGVSLSLARLPLEMGAGATIFIDDGRIKLRVESVKTNAIECLVEHGGELAPHRGVNVPGVALSLPAVGPGDLDDLLFAARLEVDYIAASFVRRAQDVVVIREILQAREAQIPIIAKIENLEAVENLDPIVEVADGTMVARGDLGVELPVAQVPLVQKRIIRSTVLAGKPVITATEMLDSMENNTRPTRAEASDVANAILDGTSAVMLSGETARGRHPAHVVRTMGSIAHTAESALAEYGYLQQIQEEPKDPVTDAVAHAASVIASRANAAAILTLTESGKTSRAISKYRPACPILAVSTSQRVVRRLALNWGVTGLLYQGDGGDEAKVDFGVERARLLCASAGDVVVVTAGISHASGSTNMVRVVKV